MMGMWARVQAAARGGTGFADPLIYAVGRNATEDAADFNDYEVGTNGAYQAFPGWDYVTGRGTPNLTPLMKGRRPRQNGSDPGGLATQRADAGAVSGRSGGARAPHSCIGVRSAQDRGDRAGGADSGLRHDRDRHAPMQRMPVTGSLSRSTQAR
jgi:hypothetical protein